MRIPGDLRRKIAMFPITDPGIANLTATHGSSTMLLYQMLLNHVNSGKRLHRLIPVKRRGERGDVRPPEEVKPEREVTA